MRYIIGFLYAIYESAWRRWKGDGSDGKWYNHKLVKMATNLVLTFLLLLYLKHGLIISILGVLVYQFLYWTQNHGAFFDYGTGPKDDPRYNSKKWFWIKWVKKVVPEKQWYGYWFDFICMSLRYGLPSILLSFVLGSPVIAFMGFVHALVYAFCWKLNEWGKIKAPTEKAEWIVGFVCGLFMSFGG